MKKVNSWRRGSVLLQTMVISVLLAYIGISVTRWVLNRYMGATRTYRGAAARARSSGYVMKLVSDPTAPPTTAGGSSTVDGTAISYTMDATGKIQVTYDEDQP